jgi:hypothetical protein
MGTETEVLTEEDELDIEKGFNDAIDDLRKSLGQDGEEDDQTQEELNKAKAESKDDEEEAEEEEEEEEEMRYKKSIEDTLREEPEAAAAMDVEPFLLQLAKALDEGMSQLQKSVNKRVAGVEKLVKSIGNTVLAGAELQKSTNEIMTKIGEQPVPSGSVRQLRKSRFESGEGDPSEYDNRAVLQKSLEWVREGKIDLVESGMIEMRINKNVLGKSNDPLDQKVAALMKSGEAS